MPHSPAPLFSLGVNYPWHNYGQDFGGVNGAHRGVSLPANRDLLLREFAGIREAGATVVRWFVFGDGRGGFLCKNGIPLYPDPYLFKDIAAALQIAEQARLQIWFSLIDYLWLQEHAGRRPAHAHEHVLHFAAGRAAFLEHILIPLFREFRGHPVIYAWEVANEPEWSIREFAPAPTAKLPVAEFRAYAREITRAIHEFAVAPATLGCARLPWLRAWSQLGLDFYDAHYYPSCEKETGGDLPQQLASVAPLDKPLFIGELPWQDPEATDYCLARALTACRDAGLSGAAVWRWTQPEISGSDRHIGCVDPALLRTWAVLTLNSGVEGLIFEPTAGMKFETIQLAT
jgi:hypothetical protein